MSVTEQMVARGSNYASKQARLKKDEEELAALMAAQQKGAAPDEEDEVPEVDTEEPEDKSTDQPDPKDPEDQEDNLSSEEASFKKRYGDLRRHLAKKEREWEKKLEDLGNKVDEKGDDKFTVPANIESWAKDNPEAAAVIEALAEKKAREQISDAEAKISVLTEANDRSKRQDTEAEIRKSHADFDSLRDSDVFHDWAEAQPKWVKDALYENSDDAASVVRVIDLYKSDQKDTVSAEKDKKKQAASTVSKRPTSKPDVDHEGKASMIRESDVQKMSQEVFEKRYPEIQAAMRTGKFIYDVTGKS